VETALSFSGRPINRYWSRTRRPTSRDMPVQSHWCSDGSPRISLCIAVSHLVLASLSRRPSRPSVSIDWSRASDDASSWLSYSCSCSCSCLPWPAGRSRVCAWSRKWAGTARWSRLRALALLWVKVWVKVWVWLRGGRSRSHHTAPAASRRCCWPGSSWCQSHGAFSRGI
jgi:hypothetical protein